MPRNQSGSPSQGKRELSSRGSSICGVPPSKTLKRASVSSSKITFVCLKRITFKLEFKIGQRMALNTGSFGLVLYPSAGSRAPTPDLKAQRGSASSDCLGSAGPAHTSLARSSGSHCPLHRKPARSAKEVPDLSWRKARPGCAFYPRFLHPGRPGRSSPPPGARGLTWRGVSASHPRPGTCESRTNPNLPGLTHPRLGAGGGSGVSGDSHKSFPSRDAQAPGRAR